MIGFLLIFASTADARVKLILKDGIILTWSNYFEEKDQYCTHKPYGKFCISKSDVASIQVEDESRGTTSIPTKAPPEARKGQDQPKQLVKEKLEAEKEKVKERENPIGEKAFRFEVQNPNVRILIPELPPIAMKPHPYGSNQTRLAISWYCRAIPCNPKDPHR